MSKDYKPSSKFLKAMIDRTERRGQNREDGAIIAQLIRLTRDRDRRNRDWATLLLRQQEIDSPEVREALVAAANDEDRAVRGEAIRGLAELDPALALPFIRNELASRYVSAPLLEAAAIAADPSLIADLRAFAEPSNNKYLDDLANEALAACESTRGA